ncbi:MAG: FAD-dependent oxidoreductase [Dehalococcoidia bacterium]|nr:FAD-dependent oxidoreductase [Dehalococcoidia bacterium]
MRIDAVPKWDISADVVILGTGAAGISAAIEAAGAGAETLLVEKERNPFKSATVISGGAISFAGTDLQAERGIEDSSDLFFSDLLKVGRSKNDVELVKTFMDLQLDTYYWLKSKGIEFLSIVVAAGMSVPRAHIARMGKTMSLLADGAKQAGARLQFDTKGERLVTDEAGRVVGLKIAGPEGQKFVEARRGIIIATGGFGHSDQFASLTPIDVSKIRNFTARNSTGDGLKMAFELGAGLSDLAYIRPTFGAAVNAASTHDMLLANYRGAIIVNKMGKRFVDESLPYKEIGSFALSQPQGVGIMIFDSKIRDKLQKYWLGLNSRLGKLCKEAPGIADLASAIDVPSGVLVDTVEQYNDYVERRDDREFGRKGLAGPVGEMVKLDTPPFYAFEAVGALVGTYAGLTIDTKTRVRNVFGEVIPGLYAVGEVIAGFHGAGYMTGTALAKAFVLGRIAGREVAL